MSNPVQVRRVKVERIGDSFGSLTASIEIPENIYAAIGSPDELELRLIKNEAGWMVVLGAVGKGKRDD